MTNTMPMLTDSERDQLTHCARVLISVSSNSEIVEVARIALAALSADTSKLAELAAKVRKVRGDAADFDGDRRGMWEHQEEQEQLLLEEAVKYTAPPVPALKLPDEKPADWCNENMDDVSLSEEIGFNKCLAEVKALNGVAK